MLVKLWAFILLTRPLFLIGGTLVYGLGAAIAATSGTAIDWARYALGQVLVTSLQLMTHYSNEYFDAESDRGIGTDRTWFSGGSGVLPSGKLSPHVAHVAARVCGAIAIGVIAIVFFVNPLVSVIGGLALLGAWFYSAPPLRLSASGIGELTTSLIVAFLTPLTGMLMQRDTFDLRLLAITLPLVLIHFAMLLAFEFPDVDADRKAGKRTLAVRLGRRRAARLHNGLLLTAFGIFLIAALSRWVDPHIALWMLLVTPLAAWQVIGVLWRTRHGWNHYLLLTMGGVGLFTMTTLSLLAGILSWNG